MANMTANDPDENPAQPLPQLLTLEAASADRFTARSESIGTPHLYGGQVLAQALVAASKTVPADRPVHSLHGYFLLPGAHTEVAYQVQRIRDGRSFSTRRVCAVQGDKEIFEAMVSFHVAETGVAHQSDMAAVAGPEGVQSEIEQLKRLRDRLPPKFQTPNVAPVGLEYRRVQPFDFLVPRAHQGLNSIWLRPVAPLPDDPMLHRAVLAYASDHGLLMTPMVHHGLSFVLGQVIPASLDHAMWFHRDFRLDDWVLYQTDTPVAHGARAYCRGTFYSSRGELIASTVQEGVMRIPGQAGNSGHPVIVTP